MYSPKINEDLIPQIYRAAKSQKIPMTRWVNQVLTQALGQASQVTTPSDLVREAVVAIDSNNFNDHNIKMGSQ